jgi:hypothetical protein
MVSWVAVLLAAVETSEQRVGAPPPAQLSYVRESGAEACPTAAELREAVAARLGHDPFGGAAEGTVLARIRRVERGFVGSIELIDASEQAHGERELRTSGESCSEMGQAMALSISIAVAPEGALAAPAVARLAAQKEPARASVIGAPKLRPTADRGAVLTPEPTRTRVQLSLGVLTLIGVAPSPAFGGSLTAQLRHGAWSLGAGARFARSASTAVREDAELDATFAAGEVSGCFEHVPFEHCTLLLVGATWAQSDGVAVPRSDVGIFGAAGWRSGVVATVSERWSLLAQLEAAAAFSPIHAQVDGQDVWQAPRLVGGLTAGARAHF